MDVISFYQTAAAVVLGNLVSIIAAFAFRAVYRLEAKGVERSRLPLWSLAALFAPGALIAWAAFMLTTS